MKQCYPINDGFRIVFNGRANKGKPSPVYLSDNHTCLKRVYLAVQGTGDVKITASDGTGALIGTWTGTAMATGENVTLHWHLDPSALVVIEGAGSNVEVLASFVFIRRVDA